MKAIEIIKGFCANWNDCENCDWVDVPDDRDYDEWAREHFGFVPAGLKPGVTYLVVWGEQRFITGRAYEEPDIYYLDVDYEARFYEIEQ